MTKGECHEPEHHRTVFHLLVLEAPCVLGQVGGGTESEGRRQGEEVLLLCECLPATNRASLTAPVCQCMRLRVHVLCVCEGVCACVNIIIISQA